MVINRQKILYLFNRTYCSYWAGCLLLFGGSYLSGEGYIFVKEKGIPERLIPQDCPAGKVPEATKLTPTQAHLYAWQKTSNFKLNKFKKGAKPYLGVIEQILENEQEYAQTHYIFYHAQNGAFRFFQDFLKEFYAFLNIQASFSHFEFLRAYHEAMPRADVNQFLDDQKKRIEMNWGFDHLPEISCKLLSVNLSLFGNIKCSGECTFRYFKNGTSWAHFDMDWIIKTIHRLLKIPLSKDEKRELSDLFKKTGGSSGSLFQICIPRKLVDDCAYLCKPYGIPYSEQLIASCYDSSKKRHIRISDILDAYVMPGFLNFYSLDELQSRILLSQDIVLNPNNDVKIFRFTQTNNNDTYQEKLVQFIHRIAIRYLACPTYVDKNRSSLVPFHRLASMLLK